MVSCLPFGFFDRRLLSFKRCGTLATALARGELLRREIASSNRGGSASRRARAGAVTVQRAVLDGRLRMVANALFRSILRFLATTARRAASVHGNGGFDSFVLCQ